MKSTFRITMAPLAFTLTVLLCGTLSAQSVADRFKQLDKDGDGKLSTSEAGTLGFFKPADSNRDGLVTLKSIRVPVMILHGDQHDLVKLNKPLFLPLMQEAAIDVEYVEYSGFGHGFYFGGGDDRWGKGADEAVVEQVVSDVHQFFSQKTRSPIQLPR